MTKLVGSILGHPVSKYRRMPDSSLAIPDCMLGVEFEFEGVRAQAIAEAAAFIGLWALKDDGSLRNQGKEFVFKEPLFGVDATTAITQLVELAIKHKFACNVRTGLHIHVDCRDMSTDSLRAMCLAYAIAEPFIYKWIGDNREESNFCVPWYYSEEAITAAARIIKALTSEESTDVRGGNSNVAAAGYQRYAGFNMNSLERFGSVEFRHMQTCINLKRIMQWVNMVLHLKKAGTSFKSKDLYHQLIKGTPSTVLHCALGSGADSVLETCSGQTKELLDTGRENMVNLYGLTSVADNPYERFSKKLDKFKGANKGLQKFKARKGGTPIEEAPPVAGAPRPEDLVFWRNPLGDRLAADFEAAQQRPNVRMAGGAFQEEVAPALAPDDEWLNNFRRAQEALQRQQQPRIPRPNRPANRR